MFNSFLTIANMYSVESFAYIGVLALDLQYLTMPHLKKIKYQFPIT